MKRALLPLFAGITALLALPASAESVKVQLSRPALIDGQNFAPGTYYIHTPPAGETGPVLFVNAATGTEVYIRAVQTSERAGKPQAILTRHGREDRLTEIRTSKATFEFPRLSQLASAE